MPVVSSECCTGSVGSTSAMTALCGPSTTSLPTNGCTWVGARGMVAAPEPQGAPPAVVAMLSVAANPQPAWKPADCGR